MTMTRDLYLAILSMDSYNRAYGANITDLSESGQLGNASLITRASLGIDNTIYQNWQAQGFYAIAYDVTNAGVAGLSGKVVSYRGTNFNINWSVSEFFTSPAVLDAANGWTVGAGLLTNQAGLALQFYRAVIGSGTDPFAADVTLTGHSLGAGLAGFVGSLYGRNGVMYDNIRDRSGKRLHAVAGRH
jgi:hypothetical protein